MYFYRLKYGISFYEMTTKFPLYLSAQDLLCNICMYDITYTRMHNQVKTSNLNMNGEHYNCRRSVLQIWKCIKYCLLPGAFFFRQRFIQLAG